MPPKSKDSLELLKKIIKASSETKAYDTIAIDVRKKSSICDYLLFLSGESSKQVQGIANNIAKELSDKGFKNFSMEGFSLGEWILIDFHDVIVHVFVEEVRRHYDLESIWKSTPKLNIDEKKGEIIKW